MKLIIEKNGVKREIEGPFALCASESDIVAPIRALERRGGGWVMGWIDITDFDPPTRNTTPRKWEE